MVRAEDRGLTPRFFFVYGLWLWFFCNVKSLITAARNFYFIQINSFRAEEYSLEHFIEAYEKTLAVEKEIATQKAVTTEQKEIVVTKYKTLTKTIEKRGEIKPDEKSNFTIINF